MFPRLCQYSRPLTLRACRSFCSRGNDGRLVIRQRLPWRRFRHFDEFFPNGSLTRNWIQETERHFGDIFGPAGRWNSEFGFRTPSGVQMTYNKELFEVKLDLGEFKAEDLEVTLTDGRLQVRARHEQKQDDHGLVTRDFTREFDVPKDVDVDSMTSTLSEDGWMTIRANVKAAEKEPDKVIEIKRGSSDTPV